MFGSSDHCATADGNTKGPLIMSCGRDALIPPCEVIRPDDVKPKDRDESVVPSLTTV